MAVEIHSIETKQAESDSDMTQMLEFQTESKVTAVVMVYQQIAPCKAQVFSSEGLERQLGHGGPVLLSGLIH